jgi:hypothetical protein
MDVRVDGIRLTRSALTFKVATDKTIDVQRID